jgi:hypothetical protein
MPKSLLNRFAVECIGEFRQSADVRHQEGLALAAAGFGTGAIYLWGYAVEMTLKAAYFRLIGFGPADPIHLSDLRTALGHSPASTASSLGMTPTGNLHDIAGWGQLITLYRRANGPAYPSVDLERQIRRATAYAGGLWRETIRYHKNRAYAHEVEGMRAATAWVLEHSPDI